MKIKKVILSLILFSSLFTFELFAQTSIPVTDDIDFQTAIEFANTNGVDTIYLTTSGGVYTTTDEDYFHINTPLVIMAQPDLAEMPIITHSDDSSDVLEIFRYSDHFTLQGVILDGMHAQTHANGMKYGIRAGTGPGGSPPFKEGSNLIVRNCVFRNFYEDRDTVNAEGDALKFLKDVKAGIVKIENCIIENIGDEAIRLSETEKYDTDRCVDSLIVRNCTFSNVGAECIRFYADTDTSTADAVVIIENLTINNCAVRTMFIKNNQNAQVRNIILTNTRMPRPGRSDRADYLIQVQQRGSYIANIDTMNIVLGPIPHDGGALQASKGGIGTIKGTVFGFDPLYADAANRDYTLPANSPAYLSGYDNTHLGDSRWATATNLTSSPLNVEIIGGGEVLFNPERQGLVFPTGTEVTVTAVPDSGFQFAEWGGDLSGTNNPATITVDGIKNITATFSDGVTDVNDEIIPSEYSMEQNYPNPFNPSTAIRFSLKKPGLTSLKIFNVLGSEVVELLNKELQSGSHTFHFNAGGLSSGVYYYQISSGKFTETKKMILIK